LYVSVELQKRLHVAYRFQDLRLFALHHLNTLQRLQNWNDLRV
jgi:hypothetical protein